MRWLVVIFWLFATPLLAQTTDEEAPAALVADRIELTADDLLVASGNVEILQGDTRMTAAEVRYDGATDTLRITGPIRIQDGPDVLILAEQAEMSQGLQDGILRSARLVLDQQLQLAAAQMQRVDGRYTQLWKVGATSCHVCGTGPPLWQIRARRIVHDQEEQQLYFDNMRFEVYGIPILYLPRLRLPDPNLDRATGFLLPSIRTTSRLGWGIKAPYFVKLGDHADVTITPYLSPRTRTVELTFRRAFVNGDIEADVNLTDDDLIDDGRWAILAEGAFDLPRDFKLTFDVQMVSDDGYLLDYGYGSQDRLPTGIEITRTDRDENTSAALISYQTLRDGEDAKTLPSITFDADYTRRLFPEVLG
ncbi:MAG: LPS assembly protein LptD, partial [Pseudomonadota bacterium]